MNAVAVDPVVVVLAVALASRTPVAALVGEDEPRPRVRVASRTERPRDACARTPRPKNRKG